MNTSIVTLSIWASAALQTQVSALACQEPIGAVLDPLWDHALRCVSALGVIVFLSRSKDVPRVIASSCILESAAGMDVIAACHHSAAHPNSTPQSILTPMSALTPLSGRTPMSVLTPMSALTPMSVLTPVRATEAVARPRRL